MGLKLKEEILFSADRGQDAVDFRLAFSFNSISDLICMAVSEVGGNGQEHGICIHKDTAGRLAELFKIISEQ